MPASFTNETAPDGRNLSLRNVRSGLKKRWNNDCSGDDLDDWCRRYCWGPRYSTFASSSDEGLYSRFDEGSHGSNGYNGYRSGRDSGVGDANDGHYNHGWDVDCWRYCGEPSRKQCNGAPASALSPELFLGICAIAISTNILV
ncbi:hypothetical protein BGX27_008866 [Mortierella sp. AM989]|nr:hypothetical protein BGX27_008866 [Mortierella sp. AM989]